jgi:hypothetical protein
MTFNPFRRTFLSAIPAAFAGLFGLGRVKADEPDIKVIGTATAPLRMTTEQIADELVRICLKMADPEISFEHYTALLLAWNAINWTVNPADYRGKTPVDLVPEIIAARHAPIERTEV